MKRDYKDNTVRAIFELTAINLQTGKSVNFEIPYSDMLSDLINVDHPNYMTFIDVRIENLE